MHAFPNGNVYPCCGSTMDLSFGNLKEKTMAEIWNNEQFRELRKNMMENQPSEACQKCYEKEQTGFFSMRNYQNRYLGHHVSEVDKTSDDGYHPEFKLRHYDIRFSNLCNLACRSCGDIFSSLWRRDAKNYGWVSKDTPNVDYAGRFKTDMWEQLQPHIPYIENIYFAGGEPLIMEEHYRLLKELISLGRTDVNLTYNTNFSELDFKGESVLELWKEFKTVSIGASLDASYERAELMRHGTNWAKVVRNRERMLREAPHVDLYISCTLGIMNSYNITELHREWSDLGLIKPRDFSINILQSPPWLRIDVLPEHHKKQLTERYTEHLKWLEPQDDLNRASSEYRAAIQFMNADDKSNLLGKFKQTVQVLDNLRDEDFWRTFPEFKDLQ